MYNKAKEKQIDKRTFLAENAFQLSPNTAIELHKMKNRDYYRFLINKDKDTPRKGTRPTSGTPSSRHLFNHVKNVWKNNKLKEFYFKLLHRMVVTRKGLLFYGMESNYQEPHSINHTFLNWHRSKQFFSEIIKWGNQENSTYFLLSPLGILFDLEQKDYPQVANKLIMKFKYAPIPQVLSIHTKIT